MIWKTLARLARQSAAPFFVSLGYAAWVYHSKGTAAKATDAVSAFGAAFFFCMWLVGQFFRTSKQLADSEHFNRLSAGIEDINRSIRELQAAPPVIISTHAPPSPVTQLMAQAKHLVQSGHVLAGLLQAGVAFEQAVHEKANRIGIKSSNFRSTSQLLTKIEEQIGPGANNELQALWKLRNQIAHADSDASSELQNRPELIRYFENAIDILTPERDPF